jgi:hypothetical protein
MLRFRIALFAAVLLQLTACDGNVAVSPSPIGDSGTADDASAPTTPRAIAVSNQRSMDTLGFTAEDANPQAVSWYGGVQQVARFRRILDGELLPVQAKLVILLNGVGNPAGPGEVGDWLADRGFHTLTVDYRNTESVRMFEDSVPDDGLAGPIEAYKEIIEGVDASRNLEVSPANSVFGRIDAALQYLSTYDPEADWGYYLDSSGHARLRDVYFFGYSFGAGTSTVIGKHYDVGRVVTASGPRYLIETNYDWLVRPSVTPVDRFYGIFGVQDPDYADFVETTELLAWPGDIVDTSLVPFPYESSHRLRTSQGHTAMCLGSQLDDVCEYAFGIAQ